MDGTDLELWIAIDEQDVQRVNEALRNGANPDCVRCEDEDDEDYRWNCPLDQAIRDGEPQIVAALLCAGADVGNKLQHTVAETAIACEQHGMLSLLLSAGADANAKAKYGIKRRYQKRQKGTLLSYAIYRNALNSASLLLGAGATWATEVSDAASKLHDPIDVAKWIAVASHAKLAGKELQLVGFGQCRKRLFDVCVGLADLDLPAPIVIEVAQRACEPFSLSLPYYIFWNATTACKHFHQRAHESILTPICSLIDAARNERRRVLDEFEVTFIAKFQAAKVFFLDGQGDRSEARAACEFVHELTARFLGANHPVALLTNEWIASKPQDPL